MNDGIAFSSGPKLRINVNDWWKDTLKEYTESGLWEKEMGKSWEKEQNPDTGEKWEPLARERKGGKILRKTGKMLDEARIVPKAGKIEVATTDYGVYHQNGTERIPERQWAGLNEKALTDLSDTALDKIFKEFNQKNA